jgi:GT2 family glycosyltransferase
MHIKKKYLGIIATNYNNSLLTIQLIESICNLKQSNFVEVNTVIIIDNNSSLEERQLLEDFKVNLSFEIFIFFSEKNLGYFSGLNRGIELIYEKEIYFDFLMVGNNDLILSSDFLVDFGNNLDIYDGIPVVCPSLIDMDGNMQNPHLLNPRGIMRNLYLNLNFSSFYLSNIIQKFIMKIRKNRVSKSQLNSGFIEEGYGACYILTPYFFERYKFLFSPFFLMFEESALTYQLKMMGMLPFYDNSLVVYHKEHSTFIKYSNYFAWKCGRDSYKLFKNLPSIFEETYLIFKK